MQGLRRQCRSGVNAPTPERSGPWPARYFLNRAWPDFPAGVFNMIVMVAPGAIAAFDVPLKLLSPAASSITGSCAEADATRADAVNPLTGTGL